MSDINTEVPHFEPHVPEFKDEAAVLRFTNNLRLRVIQTKTRNGAKLEQLSDEDLEIVLRTANDIDRQTLTTMRIAADNENADLDRRVALMAAKLNKTVQGNPYRLDGPVPESATVPEPDTSIIDAIEVDAFAMEQGISTECSAEFMKKYE